jgi:hypothetical protein
VGCVIVHDEMKVQIVRNGGFDLIEKLAKLYGAMVSIALADLPMTRPVAMSRVANREVTPWRL